MRLLVAGGGTGGHVMPALAVLERLPGAEVLWMGTDRADRDLVEAAGLRHFDQGVSGFSKGSFVASLGRLAKSWGRVRAEVDLFAPDACLATGGYAAVPGALAARRRGVRLVLIEPNALPGRATRLLRPFAWRIAATEAGASRLDKRAVPVGVPVRRAVTMATRSGARRRLGLHPESTVVAVTGGSQGASSLNEALLSSLAGPEDPALRVIKFLWQAGPDTDEVRRRLGEWPGGAEVVAYTDSMTDWMAAADAVVARAGASTCAELAALGRRAVLVPLAGGGGDQVHNARALARGKPGVRALSPAAAPLELLKALRDALSAPEPEPTATDAAAEVARWLGSP